jgi:hypothetical protein
MAGLNLEGKAAGIMASPEGIRLSFDFLPVKFAGINSAARQRTLILVSFSFLVE